MLWALKRTERSQASGFHIWFEYRKIFGSPEIEGRWQIHAPFKNDEYKTTSKMDEIF
jgi:hypothetical protein